MFKRKASQLSPEPEDPEDIPNKNVLVAEENSGQNPTTSSSKTDVDIESTEKAIKLHQSISWILGELNKKCEEKLSTERKKIASSEGAKKIPDELKKHFPHVFHNSYLMSQKMEAARPYNFFMTTITASPETHADPQFVTFFDLFDPSLGELESTVQINQNVDFEWLMAQYKVAGIDKLPLVVVYNSGRKVRTIKNDYVDNLVPIKKSPDHNSKIMILSYSDGSMRIIVFTANLYKVDWDNRVQGLWVSDKLPPHHKSMDERNGESPTKFRSHLIKYLRSYDVKELNSTIKRIQTCEFSSVKVYLVASRPTEEIDSSKDLALSRVEDIFRSNIISAPEHLPLVVQCTSLDSYGYTAQSNFLIRDITEKFNRDKVKVIYPSEKNVKDFYDEFKKGDYCSLFFPSSMNYVSQAIWLRELLYQWKSDSRFCTKAVPNIRTYSCFDIDKLYWFMLTTHDATKTAWGKTTKIGAGEKIKFSIRNYEVGVVFCPRSILGADYFPLKETEDNKNPIFKLPFDTDMKSYDADTDKPFYSDEFTRALIQFE